MSLWLAALPVYQAALLVIVLMTGLTMLGPYAVRRVFGLERLVENNEVAGFKYAVLGVVYAVLLGFAVIVVWERFRDASEAVTQEAAAIASIYRLSPGIDDAARPGIVAAASRYAHTVVEEDWPAMSRGGLSRDATRDLTALYASVLAIRPVDARDQVVMQSMLGALAQLTEARRACYELSGGTVPDVLWGILFFGALVTLSFSFFFGTRNLAAQTMMAGMLAVVIFMALFVIVETDHPFTGTISVSAEPIEYVLRSVGEPAPAR